MDRSRTKTSRKKLIRLVLISRKTLGTILIVTGVFLLVGSNLLPSLQSIKLPNTDLNITEVEKSLDNDPIRIDETLLKDSENLGNYPRRVLIPNAGIDVTIEPAKVTNGKWEVFEKVGSYGLGSGVPGSAGNTVVFAHAREGLFLPLKSVKKDMVVYVLTETNWFQYKIEDIKEVLPSDVSVIKATEDEKLTLYTCSGFADSKRLIVSAQRLD